jgi:hypothetical protein
MKEHYDRVLISAIERLNSNPHCYEAMDYFGSSLIAARDADVCPRHLDQYVSQANSIFGDLS